MTDGSKTARLDALFCSEVSKMAVELSSCAKELASNPGLPDAAKKIERIRFIGHSLLGAGTLYGYPRVSQLGASIEKLADALRSGRVSPGSAVGALIADCSTSLADTSGPNRADAAVAARLAELAWKCDCALHDADRPGST